MMDKTHSLGSPLYSTDCLGFYVFSRSVPAISATVGGKAKMDMDVINVI